MSATSASPRWIIPALLLAPMVAGAHDWPCARHDPQRTGAATGPLRLPAPAVRWRHYLGGQLRDDQWRVADVDGDRVTDVVFVASGKVICKHADDSLVWESDLIDASSLAGLEDLDRDGRTEVVVVGERGAVLVLNGSTGRVLWEVPREHRGLGASARLGDLDGDGLAELYVGQCVLSTVGSSVYSFRDGYAAPRTLWQVPSSTQRCGTQNDLLADVDGDGMREVVIAQGDTTMRVLDGRSGVLRWEVPAPSSGSFTQRSIPLAINVDDDPAAELVVVTNTIRSGTPASALAGWRSTTRRDPRSRRRRSCGRPCRRSPRAAGSRSPPTASATSTATAARSSSRASTTARPAAGTSPSATPRPAPCAPAGRASSSSACSPRPPPDSVARCSSACRTTAPPRRSPSPTARSRCAGRCPRGAPRSCSTPRSRPASASPTARSRCSSTPTPRSSCSPPPSIPRCPPRRAPSRPWWPTTSTARRPRCSAPSRPRWPRRC
ncbi:MAG: VCBS repeat-containing protein [Deltaproteobacteria bacterium]|nr:VCBS repeat-containing protein [Deltaproteobacteria bacterium]